MVCSLPLYKIDLLDLLHPVHDLNMLNEVRCVS